MMNRLHPPATQRESRSDRATTASKIKAASVTYSFADQALAVGSSFLANIVLARTQTREEYGMFALSYSVFTFIAGIHSAVILEPCTVYGSGRYRNRFSAYLRLMVRANVCIGIALSTLTLISYLLLRWFAPQLASWPLLGLGLTVGVLLWGPFLRRVFYLQRQPRLAALASSIYFLVVACGLWVAVKIQVLSGLSVFLILSVGWVVAGVLLSRNFAINKSDPSFLMSEPAYYGEHWNYSKWVLATAIVFQITMQGYYWLVGGLVSVKAVAGLRAMYLLVAPVDQVFIALTLLVLPPLSSHFAGRRRPEFLLLLKQYGFAVVGFAAIFIVAVRFVGAPIMHSLYAGKFDDLAALLYVLAFLPLFMGITNTLSSGLNAAERPRVVFYAYISSGSVTLLCGIPLVVRFGLTGAVYGMLLSGFTYAAAQAIGFYSTVYRKGFSAIPSAPFAAKEAAQEIYAKG